MSFNRIRLQFLYIGLGSALLSGACVYVLYRAAAMVISVSPHSELLYIRLIRWVIHHIGTRPALLMTMGGLFLVLFFLRSNKIKDQVEAWSRKRTGRLAAGGGERKL